MLVIVSPFKKSFDDLGLTYRVPKILEKYIKVGILVDFPLQNQIISGIILQIIQKNDLQIDISKLKEIDSVKYEFPILYDYQIQTLKWISNYYFCRIHCSLNLFLPNIIRKKIENLKFDLESKKRYQYIFNYLKTLTKSQNNALSAIEKSKKSIIFYGVTGAGKTEIYISLIKKYFDLGFQTLLLVPEIILNNQIFERFKKVFGEDILLINSSITETGKYNAWRDIYLNKAKIIIGTRSSLFYPYKNLGLVIVDEEHDSSYKSDKTPKLDIRELLEKMKDYFNFKLIFASGTPSVKTMYKGLKGQFDIVNLLEEYK